MPWMGGVDGLCLACLHVAVPVMLVSVRGAANYNDGCGGISL
jgi:hypothetical protein